MRTSPIAAALAAIALLVTGCGPSRQRDPCDGIADTCTAEGTLRCSPDHPAVEVCVEDDEGCLVWDLEQACEEPGEHCVDSGGRVSCVPGCTSSCEPGAQRCDGSRRVECRLAPSACWSWIALEDCAETGRFCSERGDEASCEETCTDECPAEGATRCLDTLVQGCVEVGSGCLSWTASEDCAERGLVCVEEGAGAECRCPDPCPVGALRCSGAVVQSCEWDPRGCPSWVDLIDCGAFGLPCSDADAPAACVNGTGDDCADPIVLLSRFEVFSGELFGSDFGDEQIFSDPSCLERDGQPEAVFAVDVEEGGTLFVTERGPIDVTFSVQAACDPAGPCAVSVDDLPAAGLLYEVPAPGRYFVVIERSYRGGEAYRIEIGVRYPEQCDNGLDDDLDGLVDCDDPDCFGVPPACTTERTCDDGEDNDLDGLVDCDDPDCGSEPACLPVQGFWELFDSAGRPDVAGHAIVFAPDPTAAEGYGWTERSGVTGFAVAPGSGTVSTPLALSDDSFVAVDLTTMAGFTFYGVRHTTVFVGSNGFVTFGEGSRSWSGYLADHFARPGVSGLRSDLDPAAGGTVVVDQLADRVAVTWEGVPRYGRSAPNDFQVLLRADGGIELVYLAVGVADALVGISSGVGLPEYPPETDFVAPLPEDCGDGVDNDFDGLVDCADPDCFGDPVHCATETLCDDGLDNDADGLVDCDDPDCAGPLCSPYRGYWERFDTGDPPDLEGSSLAFSPSAASPEGYIWTVAPMTSTTFPVPPGSGLASTVLALGDDDFDEVPLTIMSSFPFYGLTWSSLFVAINGYVTFGSGSGSPANGPADHFALPGISVFRRDMYPTAGARIVVDELADRVAVTWEGVVGWAGPNDMQLVLEAGGAIACHYVHVPVRDRVTGLVGISNGLGNGTWPGETNFVP